MSEKKRTPAGAIRPAQEGAAVLMRLLQQLVVLLLAVLWFFPLTARFHNTFGTQVKNSFLLAFAQLPRTLLVLLIWVLMIGTPIFLFDLFMYFGWFWLLCGVSLPMYLTAKLFRNSLQLDQSKEEQEGQD